jgi:hypothetical protein
MEFELAGSHIGFNTESFRSAFAGKPDIGRWFILKGLCNNNRSGNVILMENAIFLQRLKFVFQPVAEPQTGVYENQTISRFIIDLIDGKPCSVSEKGRQILTAGESGRIVGKTTDKLFPKSIYAAPQRIDRSTEGQGVEIGKFTIFENYQSIGHFHHSLSEFAPKF